MFFTLAYHLVEDQNEHRLSITRDAFINQVKWDWDLMLANDPENAVTVAKKLGLKS